MTTYYEQVPTLEMRVAASPLIVTGTIGRAVNTKIDYYDGEPFVRTAYEVTLDQMLKGSPETPVIQVEVPGGEAEGVSTPQQTPVREGASLALILGPPAGEDAYVPYFGSAFPLEPDGRILLGSAAAETLSSEKVLIEGERISLEELRGLVARVAEVQAEAADAAATAGDAEQQLPPVLEMPLGFEGGGQPGAPEASEPRG